MSLTKQSAAYVPYPRQSVDAHHGEVSSGSASPAKLYDSKTVHLFDAQATEQIAHPNLDDTIAQKEILDKAAQAATEAYEQLVKDGAEKNDVLMQAEAEHKPTDTVLADVFEVSEAGDRAHDRLVAAKVASRNHYISNQTDYHEAAIREDHERTAGKQALASLALEPYKPGNDLFLDTPAGQSTATQSAPRKQT